MKLSVMITAVLFLAAGQPAAAQSQWQPPIGVPAPAFGITNTQPSAPASWSQSTPSATAGFYYVCRSCAGATDSSNQYGHPGRPRVSVPTSLPGGSYVQIQGSGYQLGAETYWTMSGTSSAPVWIVGVNNPDFRGSESDLELRGDYWIVKGLRLVNVRVRTGNGSTHVGSRFTAFRDIELTGWTGTGTTNMIGLYGSPSAPARDQVFYNLNVHDNGPLSDSGGDIDQHGMGVGAFAQNIWILDSQFRRNTGDGVQINSSNGQITSLTDSQLGHHIYVARNTFEANLQTGFWVKDARDVIFSQNVSYGHQTSRYAPGVCGGGQYGPERVWFLYNTCYNNHGGLRIQSDSALHGRDMYFIGNVIYNNRLPNPSSSPSGDDQAGIVMRDMDNRYLINNTIWGNDGGIHCNTSPMSTLVIVNNIVGGHQNPADGDILCDVTAPSTTISHNVFQGNRLMYDHSAETLASFVLRTGLGANSTIATPAFLSLANNDFRLSLTDTVARDRGIAHQVYSTFQSLYGISIAVDAQYGARPAGLGWDLGAYEAGSGETVPSPLAPANLRIIR